MDWRLAKALEVLRSEVNAKWPSRKRDWDGSIGDEHHQTRDSDHNPWIKDPPGPHVVSAIDITHDPAHGFDSYAFAEYLRTQRDPRIKYVISNRRIFSSEVSPWQWRPYHGSNPHDHHVHISVQDDKKHYDDAAPWNIGTVVLHSDPEVVHPAPTKGLLKFGSTGEDVKLLQSKLVNHGYVLDILGVFDLRTKMIVERWQKSNGLKADGVVGPQTWKSLS